MSRLAQPGAQLRRKPVVRETSLVGGECQALARFRSLNGSTKLLTLSMRSSRGAYLALNPKSILLFDSALELFKPNNLNLISDLTRARFGTIVFAYAMAAGTYREVALAIIKLMANINGTFHFLARRSVDLKYSRPRLEDKIGSDTSPLVHTLWWDLPIITSFPA